MRRLERLLVAVASACALITLGFGCDCGGLPLPGGDDGSVIAGGEGGSGGEGGGGGAGGGQAGGGGLDVDAGDAAVDAGDGDAGVDGGSDGGSDAGCEPLDCTGRCGPIRDFCSGRVQQCGVCLNGLVCNLVSHLCMQPAVDCAQLGAECGQVQNSCGARLNCGACSSAAQECDRNTHTCVACNNPTCADLGYQCGDAWLGCGPYTNTTNCGGCDAGYGCNTGLHVCEPLCTPTSDPLLCTARGSQCGYISNGCGGQAFCGGCDAGTSCGARGIANVCDFPELPNECVAANVTCGTLQSACGGPTLDCGQCSGTDVCTNGSCGPPCDAGTCADYPNQCGVWLDAGCGAPVTCACQGALECTTAAPGQEGNCVVPSGCAAFNALGLPGQLCSNDPSPVFPTGAGTDLACPCINGGLCIDADGGVVSGPASGACCRNTIACPANSCGITVTDACTGASIPCACSVANTHCNTAVSQCEPNHTCTTYGANGNATNPCSNGTSPAFPRDNTTNLACPCLTGGLCNVPGQQTIAPAGTQGACCFNTVACGANECNITKFNACTGAPITCACTAAGTHCNNTNNTCEADTGCTAFTQGLAGQPCSNGASTAFPKGDGTFLTCPCTAPGARCFDGGVQLPVGSPTPGTCCVSNTCPAGSCGTIVDQCTGATVQCTCSGATHCNTGNNLCEPNLTCASYSATGAVGAACSNGPAFSNGAAPPTLLTCPCTGGGVLCTNGTTVVSGTGCGTVGNPCATGTCCQNTQLCGNQCNVTLTNSCTGAAIPCNCGANAYCSSTTGPGTCIPYATCATQVPPANGAAGAPCSTSANTSFPRFPADPTGLTCNCTGGRWCSVAGTPPHLADAGEVGSCCTNTNLCAGRCNITIQNSCTNANIPCTCSGSNYCDTGANLCRPYNTCVSLGADGGVGRPCSNGNDPTDFPRYPADPTGLTCRCAGTAGCYSGGAVVSGAAGGTCCQPDVCPANTCASILERCSGQTIACSCSTGNYCSGGACRPYETCSSLGANGAPGQACSNGASPTFPRGDGSNLTCPCAGGLCVDAGVVVSGTRSGSCCVNTAVCPANTCGSVINTCTGATINCSCAANNHCDGGTCLVDRTCASYTATGAIGAPCSTGPTTAFHDGPGGINLTCPCSTGAPNQNNLCVGSSGTVAGTCTCTPSTPANCGANGQPNGCGGSMVFSCGAQVCYQNACCTPPVCPAGNAGDVCGSITACGQNVNCPCTAAYQSCGAVDAGICGCRPLTLGDCGTTLPDGGVMVGIYPDGCGSTVTCPF